MAARTPIPGLLALLDRILGLVGSAAKAVVASSAVVQLVVQVVQLAKCQPLVMVAMMMMMLTMTMTTTQLALQLAVQLAAGGNQQELGVGSATASLACQERARILRGWTENMGAFRVFIIVKNVKLRSRAISKSLTFWKTCAFF